MYICAASLRIYITLPFRFRIAFLCQRLSQEMSGTTMGCMLEAVSLIVWGGSETWRTSFWSSLPRRSCFFLGTTWGVVPCCMGFVCHTGCFFLLTRFADDDDDVDGYQYVWLLLLLLRMMVLFCCCCCVGNHLMRWFLCLSCLFFFISDYCCYNCWHHWYHCSTLLYMIVLHWCMLSVLSFISVINVC